jgi:hypothetical protein
MGELSAGAAAFHGFGLIKRDPQTFLGVVLLLFVYVLGALALLVGPYIAFFEVAMSEPEDPTVALSALGGFFSALGLYVLLCVLVFALLLGAANRALVFGSSKGWVLGLKLGMDEVRVILVSIVGYFLILLPYLGAVIVSAVIGGVLTATTQNPAGMLVIVLGYIVGIVLMIWVGVRLSFAGPATVGEKRFIIFESWSMTKGKFWTLFLAYLILYAIILVIELVVFFVGFGVFMSSLAADPAGLERFEDPEVVIELVRGFSLGPAVIVGCALYAVIAAFFYAAFLGVAARGYLAWKEGAGGSPRAEPA